MALCSGGYDLLRLGEAMEVTSLIGGTPAEKADLMRLGSPLYHVGPGAPPFLIAHGTGDRTVPFDQATRMHKALMAPGVEVEFVPLRDRYHSWTGFEETVSIPDDAWRYWEFAPMALPFFVKYLRSPVAY